MKLLERPSPKVILKRCAELGLGQDAVADALGVNARTVDRWEEGKAEPNEGALRALDKLEEACKLALGLFKKKEAREWFRQPNQTLGQERPIDVLRRGAIEDVKNALGMLEWGIYS